MTAEQRLADRRERLITAAYTLFAQPGFHDTTIERLCSTARISNRAFYECFTNRDELMRAVYERCVEETLDAVSRAVEKAAPTLNDRILAGVGEYIRFVTMDVRRARLMHLEVRRAGDVLSSARQLAVKGFSQVIQNAVGDVPHALPPDLHLLSLGLTGAITELLIEWVLADPAPPVDGLIETATHIFHRSLQPET
ncbi:TetR/AcrR family transcriptional regulator [Sphaerimonospora cavernae]|uniref:TetR/AcrR family transcriptional regulator n=1 Tax=Sphaerimonospora cavernae TaxID=1740611 RepID=A0ABV6U3F2_9ACTN